MTTRRDSKSASRSFLASDNSTGKLSDISGIAPLIDAHIHLDTYSKEQQSVIFDDWQECGLKSVISVSMNLESSQRNLELARQYQGLVHPAFGFHPEQLLPSEEEIKALFEFMEKNVNDMVALGEVGLPYYSRLEALAAGEAWNNKPYENLLEQFIMFAKKHHKPIVLHAVYEDADIACDLLEKHGVTSAHFHWFKGSPETIQRMAEAGYYVSFTPDLLYEPEIQELARKYPASQVMTETDGPWPFEGPFKGQVTHPKMTAEVAEAWADIQSISLKEAREILYSNACRFYRI